MKLSAKIAYNTIIQFVSKIISTVLGLVAIAVITRYLGQTGFGEYTTAMAFLSYFAIIADLGLTLVTVQLISRPGADTERILGNLLALRLFSALILLSIAPISVLIFPYSTEIKMAVAVAALSFVFIALNQILVGLFQKNLRMDKVSIAEVISRLVLVVLIYLAVKQGWGLLGIMAATVVSSAVNFFLHYAFSMPMVRIRLYFDFAYWKKIISRSWPLALTIVFNLIYLKTDTLLLSFLPRDSQIGIIAEVGLYGAAYKVIDVLVTFPFMFAGLVLPVMTLRWAEKNKQGFKDVLQKSFNAMILVAVPLVIGAQILAGRIMILVAGPDFALSGPILRVLIGAAGLIFLGIIPAHAIIAINRQKKIIWAYIFTAVSSVAGYLVIIPKFSYMGAAWVTIYSEAFIALAGFYLIWRYAGFFPRLDVFIKSCLASLLMILPVFILQRFNLNNLFLLLSVASISYFIFIFLLRGVTRSDIKEIFNR